MFVGYIQYHVLPLRIPESTLNERLPSSQHTHLDTTIVDAKLRKKNLDYKILLKKLTTAEMLDF